MDLSVTIRGKTLPNPVGIASGVFGYAKEFELITPLTILGAIYTKAITPKPKSGNPAPRLAETRWGMLNSIGLANVGLEAFKTQKLPFLKSLGVPIVVNVAGGVEEDYAQVIEGLESEEGIWGYEINVSCPNVKHGGQTFGAQPGVLNDLIRLLRPLSHRPMIVKLSPNTADIAQLGVAAVEAGADALSAINTLKGMVIDIHKKRPKVRRGVAGFSGPAILPVGVAAVFTLARAVSVPIIGLGGISSWQDAVQYLLAGASAIQIGSALFRDSLLPQSVLVGIQEYAAQHGFNTVRDFAQALCWEGGL
jgi:dihydroorotate dehydrogenase (NAD+) catalytic subunit